MSFKQGEVIDIKGTKVVYIQMKIKKYTAIDLNDPSKIYSCKGGTSTGKFRADLVQEYFIEEQKRSVAKALKQAEDFKYKALDIGQAITMDDGKVRFVMKHKRTKLLSMDRAGDVWDSHYGAITQVVEGTIYDESESLQNEFKIKKGLK